MRRLTLLILLAVAGLLHAQAARAQACLGLPSFAGGIIHVNAGAEFPDSARSYAAGIGAGTRNGLFASVGAGRVTYEGLDGSTTFGFLELGFQVPVAGAQICPVAGGYVGRGPDGPDDDEFGVTIRSRGGSAGIALGIPVAMRGISIIPNAAVKYLYDWTEVVDESIGTERATYNNGLVDLGLAFVLGDRFSIQPLAHIPFGGEVDDEDEITFGVFLSLALFGR